MLDAPRIVSELTSFIEETEPFEWSLEPAGGSAGTRDEALPAKAD